MKAVDSRNVPKRRGLVLGAALLVFAGLTIACAPVAHSVPSIVPATVEKVETPAAAPASVVPEARAPMLSEARGLAFAFVSASTDEHGKQTSDALRAALVRNGYWLIGADGSRDATIEVRITPADKSSVSSADEARSDGPGLEVSLVLSTDHATLERLVTFVDADAESSRKRIDELVQRLSSSPRFESFAKNASASKAVKRNSPRMATTGPQAEVPGVDASGRDEAAWSESALRRCRNGRHPDDCSKVREYIESFPNGAHAANAKAALDLAGRRAAPLAAAASAPE